MRTVSAWLLAWLITVSVASAREWTDVSGTRHAEAKLQGRVGDMIWLEKSDGKVVRVPLEKLSQADRDYVEETLAGDPLTPAAPTDDPTQPATAQPNNRAQPSKRAQPSQSTQPVSKSVVKPVANAKAAAAQAQLPQPDAADAADEKETKDERGWHWKFIYCACDVTGHLIIGHHPPAPSTVSYWLDGFHRLDGLHFQRIEDGFFRFHVTYPGNKYNHWAFGREPNCCGLYPIWAWHSSSRWHFKGWACRERVW